MSYNLGRFIILVGAISYYFNADKKKYFWKRIRNFYMILLLIIPNEYLRLSALNSDSIHVKDYFSSYLLIAISISLFIFSWLMQQYEKYKQ